MRGSSRFIPRWFSIFDMFERSCQGGLLSLSHLSRPDRSLLVTCHLYFFTFLQRLYLCHICQNWFWPQGCLESGVHVLCGSYFKCLYWSLLEHLEICPSMCYAVCLTSRMHVIRQQDKNNPSTTHIVYFLHILINLLLCTLHTSN